MSTTYDPMRYCASTGTPLAIKFALNAVSSLLTRSWWRLVYDPWQRREQNRNSVTLAGFTLTTLPQNTQGISTRRSSGCLPPASDRRYARRQSTEQKRDLATAEGGRSYWLPQISQVSTALGFLFQGTKSEATRLAVAARIFARDFGLGRPSWTALVRQLAEQYLPRPLAISDGFALNILLHTGHCTASGMPDYTVIRSGNQLRRALVEA